MLIMNFENFLNKSHLTNKTLQEISTRRIFQILKPSAHRNKHEMFPEKTEVPNNDKPSLYFGLTLPNNRKVLTQKPISYFISLAEAKYNERSIPLSPTQSRKFGNSEKTVVHQFDVTKLL